MFRGLLDEDTNGARGQQRGECLKLGEVSRTSEMTCSCVQGQGRTLFPNGQAARKEEWDKAGRGEKTRERETMEEGQLAVKRTLANPGTEYPVLTLNRCLLRRYKKLEGK